MPTQSTPPTFCATIREILTTDIARDDLMEAANRLTRECMLQAASARLDAHQAKRRADRYAQILTGAAGLADAVTRGDEEHAHQLAEMVTDAIEGLGLAREQAI